MSVGINSRMVAFVVHALAVVASVMVFVWSICYRGGFAWESTNKTLIFNLHPVLTLISLVILGGEAIISYKSLPFEKRANKLIHLVLHAIAIVLGILGIYAAFKHHNEKHIPNLYTIHSWVGIGVIVLYSLQVEIDGALAASLLYDDSELTSCDTVTLRQIQQQQVMIPPCMVCPTECPQRFVCPYCPVPYPHGHDTLPFVCLYCPVPYFHVHDYPPVVVMTIS
ncbi:transmembrane ascorbate ferrireductase 1-like isoform X2 [Raphanus sativus]|uniref:Transmembrane ascorbate ferrireductase 1-like isoform X2 n=1 Tax=Raphanus sativus TaxID=3726 RepID=A0A9W3D5L3_RAPSA|nr:transmembrane ascorbate ferrireductase 1-like isoform X2 [Raphanus sativus]